MSPLGDLSEPPSAALLLHKMRSDLAYFRVLVCAFRLQLLWKSGFNPDQPRDDHGRWTDTGAGTRVAQAGGAERYRVSLPQEEARGGHAIRTHVGKSDAELYKDLRALTLRGFVNDTGMAAQGTFESLESANDFVNRVLEAHPDQVDRVVTGVSEDAWLEMRFGYPTGHEAFRPSIDEPSYMRPTYDVGVLIERDRRSPRGYTIITAYPKNSYRLEREGK